MKNDSYDSNNKICNIDLCTVKPVIYYIIKLTQTGLSKFKYVLSSLDKAYHRLFSWSNYRLKFKSGKTAILSSKLQSLPQWVQSAGERAGLAAAECPRDSLTEIFCLDFYEVKNQSVHRRPSSPALAPLVIELLLQFSSSRTSKYRSFRASRLLLNPHGRMLVGQSVIISKRAGKEDSSVLLSEHFYKKKIPMLQSNVLILRRAAEDRYNEHKPAHTNK